jgi:hypothetical protein
MAGQERSVLRGSSLAHLEYNGACLCLARTNALSLEILTCDFCRRTVRVSEQRYPAVFTTECPFDICPVNAEFRPRATSRLKEQNIAERSIAFAERSSIRYLGADSQLASGLSRLSSTAKSAGKGLDRKFVWVGWRPGERQLRTDERHRVMTSQSQEVGPAGASVGSLVQHQFAGCGPPLRLRGVLLRREQDERVEISAPNG